MDKKTTLNNWHHNHQGAMVSFGGWEMPLHYGSQLNEHHYVRKSAGIFDVSHMRVVDLQGEQIKLFCRYLLANNIDKLNIPGKALYSCMLNEQGGILDDLICYYVNDKHFRFVINAATAESDLAWITQQAQKFQLSIKPRPDLSMFALQGPQAIEWVTPLLPVSLCSQVLTLQPFQAAWLADQWFVARTGYTGEDGFEVMLPNHHAEDFWQRCVDTGFYPCGLGARDTLRLEAGLNLYGTDMDDTLTPFESNLAWTVAMQPLDRHFIGREALELQQTQGIKQHLVGVVLQGKGVMRHGQEVRVPEGVGRLTSGTFAPTLGVSVGMARLPKTNSTTCEVQIRNQWQPAQIVKMPFVKRGQKNF